MTTPSTSEHIGLFVNANAVHFGGRLFGELLCVTSGGYLWLPQRRVGVIGKLWCCSQSPVESADVLQFMMNINQIVTTGAQSHWCHAGQTRRKTLTIRVTYLLRNRFKLWADTTLDFHIFFYTHSKDKSQEYRKETL